MTPNSDLKVPSQATENTEKTQLSENNQHYLKMSFLS